MIRAVFDTNVLVSYLLTHRPPVATLLDRHLAHENFVLVTAPELLEELGPDLRRRYPDFPPLDAQELSALILPPLPDPTPAADRPGHRRSPRRA